MMKLLRRVVLVLGAALCLAGGASGQTLSEDFNAAALPPGWTNTPGGLGASWTFPGGSANVGTNQGESAILATPSLPAVNGGTGSNPYNVYFLASGALGTFIKVSDSVANTSGFIALSTTPTWYEFVFNATAGAVTVTFEGLNFSAGNGSAGIVLDAVAIQVPELNVASATAPFAIAFVGLLLAYDRRKGFAPTATA
ncbi:MAG: hypothetical protein U0894_20770 [Pirellulales bacterium]